VEIAPSCSLLHVPIDLELETGLDPDLKSWLAFSVQKMGELATLGKALVNGREAVIQQIADSAVAAATRAASPKAHDAAPRSQERRFFDPRPARRRAQEIRKEESPPELPILEALSFGSALFSVRWQIDQNFGRQQKPLDRCSFMC